MVTAQSDLSEKTVQLLKDVADKSPTVLHDATHRL